MLEELYQLTGPQKNIYLRELAYPGTSINIVSFTSVIDKEVDIDICKKVLNKIIECNDILRAKIIKTEDGIFQKIEDYTFVDIPVVYCPRKTKEEVFNEIDFNTTIPFSPIENNRLFDFKIYQLANNHIIINYKLHHIIADGWSTKVIFKQFNTFYYFISHNLDIANLPPSYLDYINTEKEYLLSDSFLKDKTYWESYIKNIPEMLSFKENILKKGSRTVRYIDELSLEFSAKINEFCKENKITPYVFFIALHSIYLYKVSGKEDFIIGTPLLNRKNKNEKNTIGMFVSTVPLRFKINKDTKLTDLFASIHADTYSALKHQRYPYSDLLDYAKEKEGYESNLFDTIISFQNVGPDMDYVDYPVNNFWNLTYNQQSSFEFHITDHNNSGKYRLSFDFAEGVVSKDEAKLVYSRFLEMINFIISNENTKVANVSYIPKEELDTIFNVYNGKYLYKPTQTLIEQFESQAQKTPNNIALKYKDNELTYKELLQKVHNFAVYLKNKGVTPNSGVTLLIHRSLEMIVAMFAVLKCGAHYLPVDPYWPEDRVKFILEDSNSKFLITNNQYINTFKKSAICIDVDNILELPDTNEDLNVNYDLNSLAYIIYTSGTTGKPKGILTSNYNVVYLLHSTRNRLVQDENDIWTLFHTYTFDFSTWEIYASLLFGSKLVIVPKETTLNPKDFLDLLVQEKVTILNQTPAYFYKVIEEEKAKNLDANLLKIRAILVGGEAVYAKPFKYWKEKYPQTTLFEVYGPTESTIFATICELTDSDIQNNETFIGYPLQNYHVYILDKNGEILPIGCDGEICITGGGLCKGYLNKPELTKEKFLYNDNVKEVIYKSGDLGFYATDGRIGYIGRNDNQVKIRGFRVEIGEIEKEILACGNISKVLVMPVENKNMTKSLVGFMETSVPNYVPEVLKKLKEKLTPYMIPKLYQFENFPLNDNGKIDRKKLLEKVKNLTENKELILPQNDLQKEIFDIICNLLNRTDISIDDDFFDDLGLDSLNIMELSIKLAKYNLEIQDINNNSSIQNLAKRIESNNARSNSNNVIEDVDIVDKQVSFDLSNVLLTGTTGFLGVHLLKELYDNQTTNKIYCLIRRKNNKNAVERIHSTLENYFSKDLAKNIFSKIEIIQGDFEVEKLGLSAKCYNTLLEKITTVIHCGANVKHYGKYDRFYNSNVVGTANLIKFCKESKAKLAHISTVSVGGFSKIGSAKVLDEEHLNIGQDFNEHVYMITKYQAECKVLNAIKNNEIEGKVFRLGNIMPRLSDMKFQINSKDNAFFSRVKTILKYKELTSEYLKMVIDVSPVDLCAKAILEIIKSNNAQTIYHIYNNNSFTIEDLLHTLNIQIKVVEPAELVNKLRTSLDPLDAHLLNDLNNGGYMETPTTCKLTKDWLASIGFNWPILDKNYLTNIFKQEMHL